MGKRGGSKILKADANAIAHKLSAEVKRGTKHDRANIRFDRVLVATFLIRRGSKAKHGHVHGALHISESQAMALAKCIISKEQYFDILRAKNMLPAEL